MRKILIAVSSVIFLLLFTLSSSPSYALRGNGSDCFSCPRIDGKTAHKYEDAGVMKCVYINDDVVCNPGQTAFECSSEQREPNPNPPAPCDEGQICSANAYKGCETRDEPDPVDQCELNAGDTCTTSNDQCRKGLGNACSMNYCVFKDPSDGKFYQMTSKAYSDSKTPLCRSFADGDAPGFHSDYEGDAALQENDPLSLPCAKNGSSYSDAKGCLKIKTALGNVRTDSTGFTRWMLGFVLSISGGIVIIIIIVAGYKLMTSQGNPDRVKNARDQLTAAIVGLLFIIFSLALLELITRDILGLPGFGS
ncbi:MAG: hypothetical protein KBD51_00480 [Candidatus Levybacteria bacterium]|nr:hypothetical protein [Candidatus Levybacteria bacterium]